VDEGENEKGTDGVRSVVGSGDTKTIKKGIRYAGSLRLVAHQSVV